MASASARVCLIWFTHATIYKEFRLKRANTISFECEQVSSQVVIDLFHERSFCPDVPPSIRKIYTLAATPTFHEIKSLSLLKLALHWERENLHRYALNLFVLYANKFQFQMHFNERGGSRCLPAIFPREIGKSRARHALCNLIRKAACDSILDAVCWPGTISPVNFSSSNESGNLGCIKAHCVCPSVAHLTNNCRHHGH